MKVLVLNPPSEGSGFSRDGRCQSSGSLWLSVFPPVMLPSIAGSVRTKYNTMLMDCIGSKISFSKCLEMAEEYRPDFTVVNTSTPTFDKDIMVAQQIKEYTKSKIIVYGEFVTNAYKEVLNKHPFIDYVVRGEAETPVMNILAGKKNSPGVATRTYDGEIWQEPDLDKLPMPAYDLMPRYCYPLKEKPWMFIRSGRGCPYKCSFCVVPKISGGKIRYHSADYMIRQVKIINKLGIYYFMLWDDMATYDKNRMLAFCKVMVKTGLSKKNKWLCTTRINHMDEELARNMRQAGCFMISLGIESGDQAVLNFNKKGITLEQVKRTVQAVRASGIKIVGHFIIGLPGDTKETIRKTIKFAKELKINFAQFYTVATYRGSELYALAKRKGWLLKKSYEQIDQVTSNLAFPNLSAKDIEELRRKAYLSFYLRPRAAYSLLSSLGIRTIIKAPLLIKKFLKFIMG